MCGGLGWGNLLVIKSWYFLTYIRQLIKLATHLASKRIRMRERILLARARLFTRARIVVSRRVTRVLELI